MLSYSIYETKTHLSKLLKRVRKGGEILVTDRGQPVARLIPYQASEDFKTRIERLVTHGRIASARSKLKFPKGVVRPGGLKRFLEDRD